MSVIRLRQYGVGPSLYPMSDNFDDNIIDAGKWNVVNTNPTAVIISETGGKLQLESTMSANANFWQDRVESIAVLNEGAVSAVLNRDPNNFAGEASAFTLAADLNNRISIARSNDGNGSVDLYIIKESSSVYTNTGLSTPSFNNQFKITYSALKEVAFWCWGGSSWVQLGTTQTVDIGTGLKAVFTLSDRANATPQTFTIDNFHLTLEDYSTQYP